MSTIETVRHMEQNYPQFVRGCKHHPNFEQMHYDYVRLYWRLRSAI